MKNIKALILIMLMVIAAMTGCGKTEPVTETGTSATTADTKVAESTTETETSTETVTETEKETETETETETESETESSISPEEIEQMEQLQLGLRYASAVGRVSLDQELFETHLGEVGRSLAEQLGEISGYQQNILEACADTPPAGPHYCAAWVSSVYENAGIYGVGGNANDMWDEYCYSSDISELEPGMIIATLHSRTDQDSDGYIYGHCGIYIGSGYVIQSTTVEGEGRKVITSIDDWIERYDPYGTVKWGYPAN
ncbi:MAG: hypothetical protein E7233_04430 [Lachnospiraceae bacterium]|nr:hypothetical protein [Lachnospiraceae bacterium]